MADAEAAASETPDLDLLESNGGSLEDYTIEKPIGKGKFSVVYRGSRNADGVRVALKKVAIFDMMDAKSREKCLKEVRLLQSLSHPNIISYLDSFIENNELIIVFEWAEAGDLKRQIRKAVEREARFDERVIWKYFSQVCEAIRHMHERRVMHRDLKPANIFLTLQGVVKVGDLGLGRAFSENTMEAHSKVGTPLYMSPEVLKGDGYDWKSDIWSLGCILYELAMLRSPFKSEGLNLYGLFKKISKGDFEPLPTHYSEELRQLAYRMVSVDASERPDISEVCEVAGRMRERTQAQRNAAAAAAASASAGPESAAPAPAAAVVPVPTTAADPEETKEGGGAGNAARGIQGHVVVSCEELLLKLSLLDYHREFLAKANRAPFSFVHFALPAHPRRGRASAAQFADAVDLATWLLSKLDVEFDASMVESQPANSVAAQLLLALQQVGLPAAAAAAIPPTSLAPGYGSSVCATLNWLADQVLARISFAFQSPAYAADDGEGEAIGGDDDDAAEADAEPDRGGGDGAFDDPVALEVEPDRSGGRCASPLIQPMIAATVPPELWADEAARVGPELSAARQRDAKLAEAQGNWRAHLMTMQGTLSVYASSGLPPPAAGAEAPVCAQLSAVAQGARNEAEEVEAVERHVNEAASELRLEYARLAEAQSSAEGRHRQFLEAVASKSQALAEVSEKAEAAAERIRSGNAAGTDDSPLQNIKAALRRVKDEARTLELRLGMIMAARLRPPSSSPPPSSSFADESALDLDLDDSL